MMPKVAWEHLTEIQRAQLAKFYPELGENKDGLKDGNQERETERTEPAPDD